MSVNILFLEPFFGGSHKEFVFGLEEYSRHSITVVTLPPRFWKWRMRGAAFEFSRLIPDPSPYDLVVTSSLMSTADLKAFWGRTCPPLLLYFHENQFSYPLAPGETRDVQYGCTNTSSALAADTVVFNSRYHYEDFFLQLSRFAGRMPDSKPSWCVDSIQEKSLVLYPGCRFAKYKKESSKGPAGSKPLIIWNHRWEHDKNPELFFHALKHLKTAGIPFRLALLGEQFEQVPEVFREAETYFEKETVHSGYVEDREDYLNWLKQGDVVVSTAFQENFGMAVVEAVRFGCFPVLPNRLSYPEILPDQVKPSSLFTTDSDLIDTLKNVLTSRRSPEMTELLKVHMSRFAWEQAIGDYDKLFEKTAAAGTHCEG